MTRRDHCPVCEDLVADYDVKCTGCRKSLCSGCATTYDALSRLAILDARFHLNPYGTTKMPKMTNREFRQFVEDVQSQQVVTVFQTDNNCDGSLQDLWDDGVATLIAALETVEDNTDLCPQGRLAKDFLCNLLYDIHFTCNMCHLGIAVRY